MKRENKLKFTVNDLDIKMNCQVLGLKGIPVKRENFGYLFALKPTGIGKHIIFLWMY